MGHLTERPRPEQSGSQSVSQAEWISGAVETLLSHYFQPKSPIEVKEAALEDWVRDLLHIPQRDISYAMGWWRRNQPRKRPGPGDIARVAREHGKKNVKNGTRGDPSRLSPDEAAMLHEHILPMARQWLTHPELRHHGEKTLEYWGEGA